uniref:Paired amphipathic helix protein Sin3-like 3 n=1 Tax=Ananas comosus var. bracteatus TaxID=296719 RepID=A0A6V7Q587_ANACO|nr:unnamed protein product [Ananas comosus var. bracteatus]
MSSSPRFSSPRALICRAQETADRREIALQYLKRVKEELHDQPNKYQEFLSIMKSFSHQRMETVDVVMKVQELFDDRWDLILGFKEFLPAGYEIAVPIEEEIAEKGNLCRVIMIRAKHMFKEHSNLMLDLSSLLNKERPITFEESLNFVKKVKARDYLLYASLFDILSRKEHKPIEMYQELLSLFRNHDDLREELARFRPDASPQPPPRRRSGTATALSGCFFSFCLFFC